MVRHVLDTVTHVVASVGSIDLARIDLTGKSMGVEGTWKGRCHNHMHALIKLFVAITLLIDVRWYGHLRG